ncbi:MAG: ABC transporter permease [Burkholderiaceae bacterium]|nr:ABC transporter permease [Burkholderiaceae bacterium]
MTKPILMHPATASVAAPSSHWQAILQQMRVPLTAAGVLILLAILLLAAFAELLAPGDPLDMAGMPLLWPGADAAHPLGTDSLGRDVWAGLAHGARASLAIGFSAAAISLLIGISIGVLSGYYGGLVDRCLMRITELFQTIPAFLLVIVLVAIYSPTLGIIQLAIGLASWPEIARLTRAEFRRLRQHDFVQAARSAGYSNAHIIVREILPNALPAIVVTTSILIASAILMESGLAFLGMGDPNVASWGGMIGTGRDQLSSEWFLTALPGAAIALTVLALNVLGDGLNDALNPRLRESS